MTVNEEGRAFMKTNSSNNLRELTDKEGALVAGGVIGAIPGYSAPLPYCLFASGATCTWNSNTGTGTCQNSYYSP
jgi:hypothetical protein